MIRSLRLVPGLIAVAVAFALPSAALGDTYCVGTASQSCSFLGYTTYPDVQSALNAAKAHAGEDTVYIQPGSYTGPFTYDSAADQSNSVHIARFSALDPTPINIGATAAAPNGVLHVTGAAPVDISEINLTVPSASKGISIGAGGATMSSVNVSAAAGATGVTGVDISSQQNRDTVAYSTIDLPRAGGNTAISDVSTGAGTAALVVTLSHLSGATGIATTDTSVDAYDDAIRASGTGIGANADSNVPVIPAVDLRHDTVVGDGGGTGLALSESENNVVGNMRNSLITGFTTSIDVEAAVAFTATLNTSYSDYGPATANHDSNSNAIINSDHDVNVPPGLVDAAGGDFRLRATSPLIDAGDPNATYSPLEPTYPLDPEFKASETPESRNEDGNGDGVAVTDIGAYEFLPHPPTARATQPASAAAGDKITFDGSGSTDPDPGDILTYQWRFDDGSTASGKVVQHAFGLPRTHSATLKVTDLERQSDSTSVTVKVTVPATIVLTKSKIPVFAGKAFVPITCPMGVDGGCFGTITLQASVPPSTPLGASKKRKRKRLTIGKQSFSADPGKRVTVKVTLTKKGVNLLKGHHQILCDVTVSSSDKRHRKRKHKTHRKITLFEATQP